MGSWLNYVRCHDDIGWGFDEEELQKLGLDPFLHKQFIINFFNGNYSYSFSKGELYEFDNETLDARISGTLASLSGLEQALELQDEYLYELAIKRILLLHSFILSYSGIPLLFSGDEIGQLNDYSYTEIESKRLDSRWLHRSKYSWDNYEKRSNKSFKEGLIYSKVKQMIQVRKSTGLFDNSIHINHFFTGDNRVFGFFKKTPDGDLIILHNFCEDKVDISTSYIKQGYFKGQFTELLQGKIVNLNDDTITIGPYQFLWLQSN